VILSPTSVDFWVAFKLVGLLGGHPLFDRCVESGIHHNVLGGVWYAAALELGRGDPRFFHFGYPDYDQTLPQNLPAFQPPERPRATLRADSRMNSRIIAERSVGT
jgi:hypothetical protein